MTRLTTLLVAVASGLSISYSSDARVASISDDSVPRAPALEPSHPAELTRASVSKKTTAELARLLLPDWPAGQFTAHELIHHDFPLDDLAAVQFFARPAPLGSDLCVRNVVYVDLQPIDGSAVTGGRRGARMKFERTIPAVQIAAAPGCRLRSGDRFAWVQPAAALAGAQQALRRLLSLQQAARGSSPLDVEVTCRTQSPSAMCDAPPRALLVSLPLRRVQIIDRQADGWRMSVLPLGPGEHYWEVLLSPKDAADQKITLGWRIPAPS